MTGLPGPINNGHLSCWADAPLAILLYWVRLVQLRSYPADRVFSWHPVLQELLQPALNADVWTAALVASIRDSLLALLYDNVPAHFKRGSMASAAEAVQYLLTPAERSDEAQCVQSPMCKTCKFNGDSRLYLNMPGPVFFCGENQFEDPALRREADGTVTLWDWTMATTTAYNPIRRDGACEDGCKGRYIKTKAAIVGKLPFNVIGFNFESE
jgi:hypothetical protein